MDLSVLFQSIWTVVAFVFFIAVVVWAWSGRRKKDFDEAARMALDDDESVPDDQVRNK
jgi:cytochrome c oxidase cbb3-type subunit 4